MLEPKCTCCFNDLRYYAITVHLAEKSWYTLLFSRLHQTTWCLQKCSTTKIRKLSMLNYFEYINFQYYAIMVRLTKKSWYTFLFSRLHRTTWGLSNCSTTKIRKLSMLNYVDYIVFRYYAIMVRLTKKLWYTILFSKLYWTIWCL